LSHRKQPLCATNSGGVLFSCASITT
jgi:hypothetical protein